MKIVSHFLSKVAGIEVYPIFALLLFVIFFALVTWHVFRLDKTFIKNMAHFPISSDNAVNPMGDGFDYTQPDGYLRASHTERSRSEAGQRDENIKMSESFNEHYQRNS